MAIYDLYCLDLLDHVGDTYFTVGQFDPWYLVLCHFVDCDSLPIDFGSLFCFVVMICYFYFRAS